MNDDQLRRALDDYAAAAPSSDPRPGLHARLARRRTMRSVAGIAAAAAFVAGTGVAVVLDGDSPAGVVVAADPSETPEPSASATVPPPSPLPSPSASTSPSPAATRTARPEPPASPAPTTPGPSRTPEPKGDPVHGQGEGEHGLRVFVTVDPGELRTGDTAVLTMRITDDDGSVHSTSIDWGDGTVESSVSTAACAPDTPLGQTRAPQPVDGTSSRSHAWRNPGEMRVKVHVVSKLQCQKDPAEEEATVEVVVRVRPGYDSSNGRAAPGASDVTTAAAPEGEDMYDVELNAVLHDADGYIGSAVVDWGDGRTTTLENDYPCDDDDGRHYPQAGFFSVTATHEYAKPGTYTVTVRFASTGCGGTDPQRASGATVVRVDSV